MDSSRGRRALHPGYRITWRGGSFNDIDDRPDGLRLETSRFVAALLEAGARIRWDGKGRAMDDVIVEQLGPRQLFAPGPLWADSGEAP